MHNAKAFAALTQTTPLAPFNFQRRDPGAHDVQIQILYCGVCHTDVHIARNEWHGTTYPCVPGHEILGRVVKVGAHVKKFKEDDTAAVGCMVDSCRVCENCKDNLEQFCEKGATFTYNAPDKISDGMTYGGYSDSIVVDEAFVLRVPKHLNPAAAAPLLCAGITTYSPLRHNKVAKRQKVGVVGLGGPVSYTHLIRRLKNFSRRSRVWPRQLQLFLNMKKVLIIEDDQIVANVYRNKLAVEGYKVETAPDGEAGLKTMRIFKPDTIILDLMLPKMSGLDVIKQVRSEDEFAKIPIIVFSNSFLTNMIQEAWKAGATKCITKSNCSPKEVIDVVRHTIGDSGAIPLSGPVVGTHAPAKPIALHTETDSAFQADLRKTFIDSLPATLVTLRASLQSLIKAENEMTRLKEIYELYRRVHALNGLSLIHI